jgi:hypothetical protein
MTFDHLYTQIYNALRSDKRRVIAESLVPGGRIYILLRTERPKKLRCEYVALRDPPTQRLMFADQHHGTGVSIPRRHAEAGGSIRITALHLTAYGLRSYSSRLPPAGEFGREAARKSEL